MRAFVFGGGEIFPEYIEERPEAGDIVICADAGYRNAQRMDVKVDILVGDFDSLGAIPNDAGEVLQVPAEKNQTDTQLAVDIAIDRGADEILIVASTSGRCDHALSSLAILEYLHTKKKIGYIVNGQNRVRFVRDSGVILIRSQYKYFSVITLDAVAKKVSIEGGKYPLKNARLERGVQFAVSNEIVKNAALITVKKGSVYVIESRDI
jgi:thiamine pyrophosphokinase